MFHFFRLLGLTFGLSLFVVTALRMIQPAEAQGVYLTIYGNRPNDTCCYVYMVNPDKRTANRVQVGTSQQPIGTSSISASGEWKVAFVRTSTAVRVYLMPVYAEIEPIRLGDQVGRSWQVQWSSQSDHLYFLSWGRGLLSALYQVSPENTQPVELTPPIFSYVRSINEQPLPHTTFTPWVLLGWSINFLFIIGGLHHLRRQKAKFKRQNGKNVELKM